MTSKTASLYQVKWLEWNVKEDKQTCDYCKETETDVSELLNKHNEVQKYFCNFPYHIPISLN